MMRRLNLASVDDARAAGILARSPVPDRNVRRQAEEICDEVRDGGDEALRHIGRRLGGGRADVAVSPAEIDAALAELSPHLRSELQAAIDAVRTVHSDQLQQPLISHPTEGVTVERRFSPLRRVGAYIPGGKAAYPSTLIMTVVPAQIAGVEQIAVATPTASDGSIPAVVLATAGLLGVSEVYAMGGAQAVAAMAYGTESIECVQKIVGPGNAWVTAAKLAVFGDVSIDLPAGPSEVVVVADDSAEARLVAIDLLCQAEHGPDSPAVLLSADPGLPDAVAAEVEALLPLLERREILAKGLSDHGILATVPNLDIAIAVANAYAPEHVSIHTSDPVAVSDRITAAGSVYVGAWSPESAGDYATGANHVLPTGGLGSAHGPLSVADFGSWRQIQTVTELGLRTLAPTIAGLADAEGLTAHRMAAEMRLEHR